MTYEIELFQGKSTENFGRCRKKPDKIGDYRTKVNAPGYEWTRTTDAGSWINVLAMLKKYLIFDSDSD